MVRRLSSVLAVVALLLGGLVAVGAPTAVAAPVAAAVPGGTYVPVTPSRVLDTRSGLGAPRATTSRVPLAVAGHGGVPTSGVSAVVLNVTVTGAPGGGWLAVSPTGTSTSSNVNFVARRSVAQLVTSKLSGSGSVVFTASAKVHVIADVVGWFSDPAHAATGATYRPSTPRRLFDSRAAGAGGRLVGGVARRVSLTSVPAGATAVAVNLTTVRPDGDVFVTAWGSGARPGTSSMNVSRGHVRSNRAIVPLGSDHRSITVFANAGRADLVVDLSGWFTAGAGAAGGSRFVALEPARLADTRLPSGEAGPIYQNAYAPLFDTVAIAGRRPVSSGLTLPPTDALIRPTAAWLTVTVVSPTSKGWLALAPTVGVPENPGRPPGSSDINFGLGATPNATLASLGDGGMTTTTSNLATAAGDATDPDLVVDIAGLFVQTPTPAAGLWTQGGNDIVHASWWNHTVPGASGDIVEVAAPYDSKTVALRRDGTVLQWTSAGQTAPTVLVRDGVHVTASSSGVYVVRADGTVWTDDFQAGMHGVAGNSTAFSPVVGLSDVSTVAVGDGGGRAILTDGGVAAWGGPTSPKARALTGLRAPVRAVSMLNGGGNGGCFAYADGSLDIRSSRSAWVTATGIGAVALAPAELGEGCYALDGSRRVHLLEVADGAVVDTVFPGVTALGLASGLAHVQDVDTDYTPDVRILTTDHQVWDRYDSGSSGSWFHVDGLDGATAIGGQGAFVTWVPPGR